MESKLCKDFICNSCGSLKTDCTQNCEKMPSVDNIDILNLPPQQYIPVISVSQPSSKTHASDSPASEEKKDRFKKPLLSHQSQASGLLSSLSALLTVDQVYEAVCHWADDVDRLFEGKQKVAFEDGLLFEAMIFVHLLKALDSTDQSLQQLLLVHAFASLKHLIDSYRIAEASESESSNGSNPKDFTKLFDHIGNFHSIEFWLWVLSEVISISTPSPLQQSSCRQDEGVSSREEDRR